MQPQNFVYVPLPANSSQTDSSDEECSEADVINKTMQQALEEHYNRESNEIIQKVIPFKLGSSPLAEINNNTIPKNLSPFKENIASEPQRKEANKV